MVAAKEDYILEPPSLHTYQPPNIVEYPGRPPTVSSDPSPTIRSALIPVSHSHALPFRQYQSWDPEKSGAVCKHLRFYSLLSPTKYENIHF